jgi:hypothetical protein
MKHINKILLTSAIFLSGCQSIPQYEVETKAAALYNQKKYNEAYPLIVKLAQDGVQDAAFTVGNMHEYGLGRPVDYKLAMNWYTKSLTYDALNHMGVFYRDGLGVNKNLEIAYLLFLTAYNNQIVAEKDFPSASENLKEIKKVMSKSQQENALCYTVAYLNNFIESHGKLSANPYSYKTFNPFVQHRNIPFKDTPMLSDVVEPIICPKS